jgi:sulfate adenylyltransferase subunit 2
MLKKLENKSIFIIREVKAQFKNPAVLWSGGKDSTTVLWIIQKALGSVHFPVIHIDTTYIFPEIYQFRNRIAKKWGLKLMIAKNEKALKCGVSPKTATRLECCTKLKTEALKQIIEKNKFDALLVSIRWDEHGIRGKERFFSPRTREFRWEYRNQPPEFWDLYTSYFGKDVHHVRVHPLLHWAEIDVWRYIKQESIPVNPLYLSKRGKRYRSLGCKFCTAPIKSGAKTVEEIIKELERSRLLEQERAGRAQDKEKGYIMQRLRALGYM